MQFTGYYLQIIAVLKCIKQFLNNIHRTLLVFQEENFESRGDKRALFFTAFICTVWIFFKTMYMYHIHNYFHLNKINPQRLLQYTTLINRPLSTLVLFQ